MAARTPTRSERMAAVTAGVFAPLAKRELLAGLGETVSKRVPLTAITPNPNQPRNSVDEDAPKFHELVGSIRRQGLIQPISLWQLDEDREEYLIIAGERRWRAFRRLAEEDPQKFGRIPASVTVLSGEDRDAVALMRGLIENIVREDLADGERAAAMVRLKESTGWSYETIADRMGMSVNRVVALSSIARHDAVRVAVDDGRITQKQAIMLGQGVKDGELAAELVDAVAGMDPGSTRAVVDAARTLPKELSVTERVRAAVEQLRPRGVALIGVAPQTETTAFPVRRNGRRIAKVTVEEVLLGSTPLGRLQRRRSATREELAEILQATCEQLDIWPTRPMGSETLLPQDSGGIGTREEV